jgi:hypothetical protein
MTDILSPSKSSRELEKYYRTLPLKITNGITDILSSSKSSGEFKKITGLATDNI